MERNPKYSDSVNAMNGCLAGCFRITRLTFTFLLVLLFGPYVGIILLCWWFIAWIIGLIFPGREFFPVRRIWTKIRALVKKQ